MSSNGIYVIDGQNESQISIYWSNNTNIIADHPCLPQPFDEFNSTDVTVTISFNLSLITNMSAWYPQICRNGEIKNKYMFSANKSNLIINNLIIDLYEFNDINFGIIGVAAEYKTHGAESELVCNNCTFQNIQNNNNEITLIYSTKNILLNNCLFTNIESINAFIVMGFQSLQMYGVIVEHCIFNESFIFIQDTGTGFESVFNDITFENCQFNNIYSQIAVVEDQWLSCELSMYNVDFLNINQGAIYRARYEFGSDITMENINISTPQSIACTSADCTIHSLFDFNFASSVNIDHMNVDYYYDVNANCYTESNGDGHSDALGDVSYLKMECANPVSLIINQIGSQMTINNTDLRINVTQSDTEYGYGYNYTVMFYSDVANHAVVVNYGDLSIANLNIYGLPFGRRFLSNYNVLNIEAFGVVLMAGFDPNALQSRIIIKQTASSATMTVRHSHFIGGHTAQINIYAGSAAIYDCVFEKGSEALWVQAAANIVMSRCSVLRIGRYWSPIYYVLGVGGRSNDLFTVDLKMVQQTALIEESTFSGFEDTEWGLFIYAEYCHHVVLRNNFFVVNATDLYYTIPANKISLKAAVKGLLYFYVNYKVLIYGNNFYKNDVNPNIPWLFLQYNGYFNYIDWKMMTPATTCLSANNFSNYAFEALQNGITSCFRQELYLCGNAETDCKEGEYGQIDAELYDKTSHFNINADIASFFTANNYGSDFVHAMDNIQINILSESAKHKLYLSYSSILILDSIFSANAALFYDSNCDVVRNERLLWEDNTEYIAKLKIICDVYGNETENYRNLNETNVTYVTRLSPTQIKFGSTSTTYYPGQKLKFDYKIFDKLDNEYNEYLFDNNASQIIVNLENSPLSLYENIEIEENGTCHICDSGVIILGVALNDVLISNDSNSLFIQTSIVTENLALMNNMIGLDVTSCPVGYGADGNGYQCHLCPDNTYNLLANSTEPCKDCLEHENNKGNVRCYLGGIHIKKDYWLGIENELIISQQCPSSYCCDPAQDGDEYCNYIENYQSDDAAILCAENRDLSVPLCGKCMEGYTESINSPKCMICDEYNYIWLIKPLLFAFIYSGYLVFFHPKKELNANTDTDTEIVENAKKESLSTSIKNLFANQDLVLMGQTLVLRVLLYYEQALGSILWPSSSSRFMSSIYAVAALFNLETISPNSGREPQCFIDGLNSKKKILLGLFSWAIVVSLLLLTFTFESYRFFCCPNRCKVLNTNFPKAFLQFLIICVGQLLSVAFKLLNCQTVGSKRVHFYFGEEECGATWTVYVSLFVIIFVFVVFTAMWLAMRRMTEEERENPNYCLNGVCKYYKPQCYYWEFVALTRRTLISAFAILYTFNWFAPCLIAALLIFLGLHHKYQPFRDNDSNVAEYIALSCVIVVVSIQMTITYVGSLSFVTSVFLTLFIIVPIIAVIIIVLIVAKKRMGERQSVVYHQPSTVTQPSIAIDINDQEEEMKNDGGQNVELQAVSSVAQYLQTSAGDQYGDHFINASGGGASLNSATMKTLEPMFKQCISIEDDDESVLLDDGVAGKQSVRV